MKRKRVKRVERLWRLEGHRVPPRRSQASGKKAQGTADNAVWNRPAVGPNAPPRSSPPRRVGDSMGVTMWASFVCRANCLHRNS
jgi:hypothetical protein